MRLQFALHTTREGRRHLTALPKLRSHLTRTVNRVAALEFSDLEAVVITVILESDNELLAINRTALSHDFYTDIITFELERSAHLVEAELYISVDRARENAERFGVDLVRELTRVVVHGLLHLCGYSDKRPSEKKRMQGRERFWLAEIYQT